MLRYVEGEHDDHLNREGQVNPSIYLASRLHGSFVPLRLMNRCVDSMHDHLTSGANALVLHEGQRKVPKVISITLPATDRKSGHRGIEKDRAQPRHEAKPTDVVNTYQTVSRKRGEPHRGEPYRGAPIWARRACSMTCWAAVVDPAECKAAELRKGQG